MADPGYTIMSFGVDAAMLYFGATPVGPSLGGYTHDPGAQWRVAEMDGFTTEFEGQQRITGYQTTLKGKLKVLDPAFLIQVHPGSASDGSSPNNVVALPDARQFFTQSQMVQDVRLVVRRVNIVTQESDFFAIVYPMMRFDNSPLSGEDSNEQMWDMTGHAVLLANQASVAAPFFYVDDYDHDTFDIDDYVTFTP